jgi:hypothetical protein
MPFPQKKKKFMHAFPAKKEVHACLPAKRDSVFSQKKGTAFRWMANLTAAKTDV